MWPFRRKRAKPTIVPPVDLDTPVTNPGLTGAIDALCAKRDEASLMAFVQQLLQANFLVATMLDEAQMRNTGGGQGTFQKGSLIKVLCVADANDRNLLPLFTDWDAIRAWTSEPVASMVMPGSQAWDFALSGYDGAVINPGGVALPLTRDQLEDLQRRGRPA